MYTTTQTSTYTVVDVRKVFGNFQADFRMIARRTDKLTQPKVEEMCHDVLVWAEGYYLDAVHITLTDAYGTVVQAARYTINEAGSALSGDRAGDNDWPNLPSTRLNIIVQFSAKWWALNESQQQAIRAKLVGSWSSTDTDTTYPHLQRSTAQGYASKGYELSKDNFK